MATSLHQRIIELENENRRLKSRLAAIGLRAVDTSFSNVAAQDLSLLAVTAAPEPESPAINDETFESEVAEILIELRADIARAFPGTAALAFDILLMEVGKKLARSV